MSTLNIPFQYQKKKKKKKITLNYPKSATKGFFLGTQERVRNNRGKRAINVRATEVLLYFEVCNVFILLKLTLLVSKVYKV